MTRVEGRVKGVLDRVAEATKPLLNQVPRPLDSEPVKPVDDLEEYMATVAQSPDPEAALISWTKQMMQQRSWSLEEAMTEAFKFVQRNEKRIQEIGKRGTL